MSASGAWRRRYQGPASPPESSSAGRRPETRRPASSTDSLAPCAARAGTGVRRGVLRRGLWPVLACALLALPLLAGLPAGAQAQTVECTAANADGSYNVPSDWALKPSNLAVGTKFRLLFVSSTKRNADSFFIRDYNTFVQTRAKAGHSAISDSCGNRFKVVASTTFHFDARYNTMTRSTDTGASIHWLSGARVANDYADFYDGGWDSYAGRDEAGSSRPMENIHVFTGSNANGTVKPLQHIGATYVTGVRRGEFRAVTTGSNGHDGEPRTCTGGPIDSGCVSEPNVPGHFYGLSPIFTVIDGREVSLGDDAYEVDEGDAVSVTLKVGWPQSTATTVGITCTHGTTSAADFTACPATVTIPANAGAHTFDIQTTKDTTVEGDETFVMAIGSVPSGFRTGTPSAATVTVVDAPVLSIEAPADADEGDSGTTDRTFTVRLSKPAAEAFIYKICYSGTASRDITQAATIPAGKDYQLLVGSRVAGSGCSTVPMAAGETSFTLIGIRVKGDTDREGDETVVATLSLESSAIALGIELGTSTATHTIQNDDTPVLSIEAPADADEGDSGTTDRTFTVRLSKPAAEAFIYKICYSGTASRDITQAATIPAGKDYQLLVGSRVAGSGCSTVPMAAGETSFTLIGIRVKGDTDREGDETVVATLSLESSAIALGIELGTSTATHTIREDDTPVLSIEAPADADEGDSGTTDRTFTVRLSKPAAEAFIYKICYSGTASRDITQAATIPAGKDYQLLVGSRVAGSGCSTVPMAAGETSFTLIGIRVKGDTDREGDETVVATLSLESSAIALGIELGTSTATHTIQEDDGARPVVTITPGASSVTEGEEARFTVRRTGSTVGAAALTVALAAQRNGAFFDISRNERPNAPTVTIPAGHSSVPFAVSTVDDGTGEADGWVKVWVQDSFSAYLGDYEPHRHGDYDTYAGSYRKNVHYPYEIAGRSAAQVTVLDDEVGGPVTAELHDFQIPAAGLPEGATGRFNLRLSRVLETWETLTLPLTLGGTAERGADYTLHCGSVAGLSCSNLASGAPSLTIDGAHVRSQNVGLALLLTAVEDGTDEQTESVALSLGGRAESINIVDAPDAVTIAFTRSTFEVRESNGPAQPCMRVTPPSGRDIPLHFTLTGTATEGRSGDYYFEDPPVLTAGQRVACFNIDLHDDAREEPDETIVLALDTAGLPAGVTLEGVTAPTLTILADDDRAPVTAELHGYLIPAAGVTEGATGRFNLTLSRVLETGETVTLPLTLGGDAERGADYTLHCGTVAGLSCSNLASGDPSLTIDGSRVRSRYLNGWALLLTAVEDDTDEEAEPVTLSLGGRAASLDIVDAPDAVTIAFTRSTFEVSEKNSPAEPCMRVTPPSGRDIPLHFTLGGTATEGRSGDYYFEDPPVLTAGRRVACFDIRVVDDTRDEPDETVILALDTARLPTWVTVGGVTDPTLTIWDRNPTVVSLARTGPGTVTEGAAVGFTVTLWRRLVADEVLDVPLAVSGARVTTADWRLALAAGTDLNTGVTLSREGTATPRLRFASAGARVATLTLEAVADGLDEGGAETFAVALGPNGAGTNGFDHQGLGTNVGGGADPHPHPTNSRFTVTVNDGDSLASTVSFGRASYSAAEGAAASVTVRIAPTRGAPTAFGLVYADVTATAGDDYAAAPASVTIPANAGSHTFTVQTSEDTTNEPEESFTLAIGTLPAGVATGSPSSTTVSIGADDEPAPVPVVTITPGASPVTEGTAAAFTVSASVGPVSDLAVTVEVAEGAGGDSVASGDEGAQTVTIAAGETSTTLSVTTQPDGTDGPGSEVTATVAPGSGYTVGTAASATVAVADGDPTTVTLTGETDPIPEAGGTKTLTLTLSRALVAGERLDLPVVMGGVARHGADYRLPCVRGLGCRALGSPGGGVFFVGGPDATRTATLTLTAIDDADDEGTGETVTVALGTPGGNLDGGATASGSVEFEITDDDDPPPVITIAGGAGVTEGSGAVFTLTADRAPSANLTVNVAVEDAPGSDFVAWDDEGAKTVTIRSGETSATHTVPTVNDDADEPDGPVRVVLRAGEGYELGAASVATVEVADDDVPVGPTLSIDDATLVEGEGPRSPFNPAITHLPFNIRLSAPQTHTVRVTATSRNSTPVSARVGQDYELARVFAEFPPGETVTQVFVQIVDDSHDEDPETFEMVLSNARGATIADAVGVGTITNDDPMPAAWLARFGRTVAEQALDGIAGRLAAPRTPGMAGTLAGLPLGSGAPSGAGAGTWSGAGTGAGLAPGGDGTGVAGPGGLASPPGRLGAGGLGSTPGGFDTAGSGNGFDETEAQSQTLTMRDALLGSRFTLTGPEDGSGGSLAFWGRAAQGSFDGREGTFSLDGEATTALLGADYARDRWLVGLALAQSEGEGDYRDTKTASRPASQTCPGGAGPLCEEAVREGDGTVEASLTAALPYASLEASQRLKLWGALGYGEGEVTLATALGGRYSADTTWRMAAAGLRGDLLEAPTQGSGPALALTSDALWARTASEKTRDLAASASDVTRLRLGLEGSWRFSLDDGGDAGAAPGASLVPKLEVGARHDGGDAETGFGVELGGGLAWVHPALGLTLDVSGRTLIAHEDGDLEDRGFAAALGFDPRPETERGPSFSLRQDFGGQASGGLDALFQSAPLDERSGSEATRRWTAEAAWGLPAFGGRYTASPHAGLGLSPDARDYTLGWRWTPHGASAPGLSFGLEATRRESDGAAPEHTVGFEASARW